MRAVAAHDPSAAIGAWGLGEHVPFGLFRAAPRATYDVLARQVSAAIDTAAAGIGALMWGADGRMSS